MIILFEHKDAPESKLSTKIGIPESGIITISEVKRPFQINGTTTNIGFVEIRYKTQFNPGANTIRIFNKTIEEVCDEINSFKFIKSR